MAVSGYEMGQLSWLGAGVYLSRYIEFSVSMDGESFYLVHRWEDQKMISSTPNGRVVHSYEGDRYKARYVRLIFSSDVNCFIDEQPTAAKKRPTSSRKSNIGTHMRRTTSKRSAAFPTAF
jgi:hypothetical protein